MSGKRISVILRRADDIDEIRGRDFTTLFEAARAAFLLAERIGEGVEDIPGGKPVEVVVMVAQRDELTVRVTPGQHL